MINTFRSVLMNSTIDMNFINRFANDLEIAIYTKANNNIENYNFICGNILCHIDPSSECKNSELIDRVINNKIAIDELINMDIYELLPSASIEAQKRIEKRLQSSIKKKYIDMKCKFCSEKTITMMEIQMRSADEPKTQAFTCDTCTREWRN